VILHTDHGEEFWEHGGFEHNHSLYDEVVRSVLWIRPPAACPSAASAEPATLADIAPTLYDYVGVRDPPPSTGGA